MCCVMVSGPRGPTVRNVLCVGGTGEYNVCVSLNRVCCSSPCV